MRIKTGLAGIKKVIEINATNWHVFTGGQYDSFTPGNFAETVRDYNALGYTLTQVVGNGLYFRKEDGTFGSRVWK